jgi:hypothetical protein
MNEKVLEKLVSLLQGRIPAKIDMETGNAGTDRELGETVNQLIDFMQEMHAFIVPLSHGELRDIRVQPGNFLASPFKELHSRLLHLTWQATRVAKGDYEQRVDFMGDFSEAFNSMIISLKQNEKMLKNKIDELEKALAHITRLEGILPICSNCKKIRLEGADPKEQNSWIPIENYISTKTDAQFTHGICPECLKKLYSEFIE